MGLAERNGMKRLTLVAMGLACYGALWIAFMLGIFVPFGRKTPVGVAFAYSPIYVLVSFACYSAAVIAWAMINFRDCPEKAVELKQEIEMARKDLASKGMKF